MPLYNVEVVASLEVGATFVIEADDQADADRQADLLADKVSIRWTVGTSPGPCLEWVEIDQTAHVDTVEEVE